jgi:two-component system, chemotaxis family, protein-glutamate methylesterase/glutaminase
LNQPAPAAQAAAPAQPLRVMIVDDAVVVRGLMARWFQDAGGIEVASTHRSGAEAVAAVERIKPDVIMLDIEMPDMDGLTALPLLLKKVPDAVVIVASTLTTRNAEISLKCLALGAVDYIAKPSTNRDVTFSTDFRRQVVEKVLTLGNRRRQRGRIPTPGTSVPAHRASVAAGLAGPSAQALDPRLVFDPRHMSSRPVETRPMARVRPTVVLVGASTGGPNAISEFLKLARPALQKLPVVITQHMPAAFTAMFADHLRRTLIIDAAEAQHGEVIEPGRVYIAPGGKHLRMTRGARGLQAVIDDGHPINFCKPAVDATFVTAAQVIGASALGVMLTGMGSDGLKGSNDIVAAGGNIIAQDEASSVVWGMPGAVAKQGLCAAIEPVPKLAQIVNILAGATRT